MSGLNKSVLKGIYTNVESMNCSPASKNLKPVPSSWNFHRQPLGPKTPWPAATAPLNEGRPGTSGTVAQRGIVRYDAKIVDRVYQLTATHSSLTTSWRSAFVVVAVVCLGWFSAIFGWSLVPPILPSDVQAAVGYLSPACRALSALGVEIRRPKQRKATVDPTQPWGGNN